MAETPKVCISYSQEVEVEGVLILHTGIIVVKNEDATLCVFH